jgi:CRP-like cAMP-binding protein
MTINAFINVANILLLCAYSVTDILWLRLFAVGSSLIAMPYFALQPTPQRAPLVWSVVFVAINLFQAWRIFLERRPVKLSAEEEEVRRLAFPDLPPRRVLEVLSLGSWSTVASGDRLLEAGKLPDALSLMVSGKAQVTNNGRVLGEFNPGDLVGSAMLLTGAAADVDAVVTEPGRQVRWLVGTLKRYLDAHPDTRIILQRHLALDLAGKVQRTQSTITSTGQS